jgi:hypothetical protein
MGLAYGVTPQFIPTNAVAPGQPVASNTLPPQVPVNGLVIDGTPVRVVVLAIAAAIGLTVLRVSGVRFNVGAST